MSTKLTYANVMATVAVFITLGGASYAAVSLRPNSVGTKQLRASAVTSAKVRDGSLLAADFRAGQLQAGPAGPAGAKGDTGAKGAPGAPGAPGTGSFPATLPAGSSETGTWGSEDKSSAGDGYAQDGISFTVPLAAAPAVSIVATGATTTHCPGTVLIPTADPGFLCVYIGLSSTPAVFVYSADGGDSPSAGRSGAVVGLHNANDAWGYGSWAVTGA